MSYLKFEQKKVCLENFRPSLEIFLNVTIDYISKCFCQPGTELSPKSFLYLLGCCLQKKYRQMTVFHRIGLPKSVSTRNHHVRETLVTFLLA